MHAVHDLSRSTASEASRYNMPLELGIFLGAKRYGGRQQLSKRCLVFEHESYQWQKYLSDMAGNDVVAHGSQDNRIIGLVRDFLNSHRPMVVVPGAVFIREKYKVFSAELPGYLERLGHEDTELQFKDLLKIVLEWQRSQV